MQFQCGSCGFYKNKTALQVHLQSKHNIYISLTRAVHQIRDCISNPIYKKDYKGKLEVYLYQSNIKDGVFILTHHGIYVYSNKRYVCYNCGGIQFKTLPQTLHHLDKTHGIHISYIRGISKKIVFLDGI